MNLAPGEDSIEARVRRRLRTLRTERGMTLKEVADAASVDLSTLSRLESGKRRLALDHIPRLAAALSVRTDDLLVEDPGRMPPLQGQAFSFDGVTLMPLTRRDETTGLVALGVTVNESRRKPPEEAWPTHAGGQRIYVLDGRLRLLLGDREYAVKPGETMEYSTEQPHWMGVMDGPVRYLAIHGRDHW
jgi:transcriptional regulator with XRE-family HTH domain